MKQFFLKNRGWIGYTIYGIFLTLVLLYLRFPSDSIRDYVRTSVHNINPGLSITFKKVSPSFFLGLRFILVECRLQDSPEQDVFKGENILVRPKILSLFSKNPEYRFYCRAYDGIIKGRINLPKNVQEGMFNLSTEFNNIHIDDNYPLPSFLTDYVDGVLEGTITYSGDNLYDTNGAGEASLTLSNGSFELMEPILDINVIYYKEVLFTAALKGQILNISDINLKGDDFLAQASGEIGLKDPIDRSSLNLKCTIEPTASFIKEAGDAALLIKQALKNGKISFTLQGTISKPNVRLI